MLVFSLCFFYISYNTEFGATHGVITRKTDMQWMEIMVYLSSKATDRGREGPALGYYYLPPAIWVRDRRRRVLLSCILTNGRIQ